METARWQGALAPATDRDERGHLVPYQAEYIWLDGSTPTQQLRSKTKIMADDATAMPIWGFDGSSTGQATGDHSDCVLQPVFSCPDPIRGGKNILVMCEVLDADTLKPHATNTRAIAAKTAKKYAKFEMWFGLEQEYTMLRLDGTPIGFPEGGGFPGPQGPYYCGVGTGKIMGRDIVEIHTQACIDAGLSISGTNPEVMAGQWEFQIGPLGVLEVGDQLNVARWLLHRIAEDYDVVISLDAKPVKGDWNGAGCHTNFSTNEMREDYAAIERACKAIGKKFDMLVANYGHDIESRLTGAHETAPWNKFSYGVSDRGASIRIPWQVEKDGKGYAEDRRPNANCDPYTVARLITEVVCSDVNGK
jgi:glutamine synthetase